MGRFIITRTETSVQFTLYSETNRVLAVSKPYATLDACKKAICSLAQYAPACPAILRGEGRRANPKFELSDGVQGFSYEMKAPNGKTVLSAGPFATKKACLRAVSMLRAGVGSAQVLLEQAGRLFPLTVGRLKEI